MFSKFGAQQPGTIVFSKSPINVQNPSNLISEFKASDRIYSVAYFTQSVKKQCQCSMPKTATKRTVEILIYKNDGYITSMNPTMQNDLFEGTTLVLNLAQLASQMTAYTNPKLSWKMYGKIKEGPLRFAKLLSALDEGKLDDALGIIMYLSKIERVNYRTGNTELMNGARVIAIVTSGNDPISSTFQGYSRFRKGDDMVYFQVSETITVSDGSIEASFSAIKGAGQYENIRCTGIYKGRYISGYIMTLEWEGEYWIEK